MRKKKLEHRIRKRKKIIGALKKMNEWKEKKTLLLGICANETRTHAHTTYEKMNSAKYKKK